VDNWINIWPRLLFEVRSPSPDDEIEEPFEVIGTIK